MEWESRSEIVYMDSHQPPRLDILGGESGMEERGATEERDETTSIGRGAGRAEDEPISRKLLGAQSHVINCTVDLLEVESIDTGEEFGEEGKFAGVETRDESIKGPCVPSA